MSWCVEGDAASAVMRKLGDSSRVRKQEKTKEELCAIHSRIQSTLDDYDELSNVKSPISNMELLDDMDSLEAILNDNVLKTKYQQKVTIFIVGYQQLCNQRVDIINQLYDFFAAYSVPSLADDDSCLEGDEANLESIHSGIEDAISTMECSVQRLNELSQDVMKYMGSLQSANSSKTNKSKKKLEKGLQNAKAELLKMTEKLLNLQQDVGLKEEKVVQLKMQLDAKKIEIGHSKKENEAEKRKSLKAQEDIKQERNALLVQVEQLQEENARKREEAEKREAMCSIEAKLKEIKDTAANELQRMKIRIDSNEIEKSEIKQELADQFQVQVQQIHEIFDSEVDDWKEECRVNIHQVLEIDMEENELQQWANNHQVVASFPPSPSNKDDKPASTYETSSVSSEVKHPSTAGSRPPEGSRELPDDPDIMDEEYWASIGTDDLESQFKLYRVKSRNQISQLTEQLQSSIAIQQNIAKESSKWQEERARLLAHIEQLKLLQEAAEADAEEAMRNLEEFAAEQEQMESEQLSDVKEESPQELLDDNSQKMDPRSTADDAGGETPEGGESPDAKPLSGATSRLSMTSGYRGRVAEKREAFNLRKLERMSSAGSAGSPNYKGVANTDLMEDFLKCYRSVVEFKDLISQEMSKHSSHLAKSHSINSIQTSNYDASNDEVKLFVGNMANTVEQSLITIGENVAAALNEGRSNLGSNEEEERLQINVRKLQEELDAVRNEFEKRSQHDAAMIMHLQNTLSETQRGNTATVGTSGSGFPSSPAGPILGKSPSNAPLGTGDSTLTVMFTRRDTEHNSRALKKSAAVGKITQETLESVVMTMESYNSIPTKRIQNLAHKLAHHTKMKVIESNVRGSNMVTSDVFNILEKMETLQRKRAQNWGREMDGLTSERRRLAALLSDALQRLETITGVFLIKPVVSFKGEEKRRYSGKISTRFNKYQVDAMLQKMQNKVQANHVPYSFMQAQNVYLVGSMFPHSPKPQSHPDPVAMVTRMSHDYVPANQEALTVSGIHNKEGDRMWNIGSSTVKSLPGSRLFRDKSPVVQQYLPSTVPRMLELDMNKFQIPSTNVHSFIGSPLSGDRLKNMELLNLRTHTTIQRNGSDLPRSKGKSPAEASTHSKSSLGYKSTAPPTTPASLMLMRENTGSSLMRLPSSSDDVHERGEEEGSLLSKPLPPIRHSSNRSSVSSMTSPRHELRSRAGSKSVPDITVVIDHLSSPLSSRKDIATSPVVEA